MIGPIKQIRRNLYGFLLKRKLAKVKTQREVINLEDANFIGMLYNAFDPENTIIVGRLADNLRREGKKVSLLGFVNGQNKDFGDEKEFFNKKEVNWMQVPTSTKVNKFIKTDFDILINAWIGEELSLEYIAALSNAKYRVGQYRPEVTYCNEMMIQIPEKKELQYLIDQISHYLNVFTPHVEKV